MKEGSAMAFHPLTEREVVIRILAAIFIGGLIGLERGMKNRPAGLRTYMLVITAEKIATMTGDIELHVQLYPPDRRRRDIDNVLKVLLDTLTIAKLYEDDSQVKRLAVEKLEPLIPEGKIVIGVKEIEKTAKKRQDSISPTGGELPAG